MEQLLFLTLSQFISVFVSLTLFQDQRSVKWSDNILISSCFGWVVWAFALIVLKINYLSIYLSLNMLCSFLFGSSAEHAKYHPACAPTPVHVQVQVQAIGWEDCVCNRVQLSRHVDSRSPTSEDLYLSLQRMSAVMSGVYHGFKTIPIQQDIITFYCSLSVIASINKW